MKTELELLEEKVIQLKAKQAHCNHEWGEAEYDPDKKEIMTERFVHLDSDSYYEQVGTGLFENVDRWSRVCKICGKREYVYEMEEVVVKSIKRPKFNK